MRRALLALVVVVVAGGAVAWAALRPHAEPPPPLDSSARPNLILIVTDDQPLDMLSVMPNVRRLLAGHGVTFRNAFVTTPLCCPSRASILTGQYARHTGVLSNTPPDGGAQRFRDESTVATWLHDAGYTTGLVGKYLNGYRDLGETYIPPGWDEWDAIDTVSQAARYYDYELNQNGDVVSYGDDPDDYSTTVLTRLALQYIESAPAPFFLYFAPIAPHRPAIPAPGDEGRFSGTRLRDVPSMDERDVSDKPWRRAISRVRTLDYMRVLRKRMRESLLSVDRAVGAIVDEIARRRGLRNTVIAFTSDNGYLLGEHRLFGKIWPYEESIRVPLVVRVPWRVPPGRVDRHLVLNIDLAPTFADLADADASPQVDGSSVVPFLHGRSSPWRNEFVVEWLGHEKHEGGPPRYDAIRTKRYLYVQYFNGRREMYDLRRDPYELRNAVHDPRMRSVRGRLQARLYRLLRH